MMMTSLDVAKDANGNTYETFPAHHPLYIEMGKNAKRLKDDGGVIWTEGLFRFQYAMDTAIFTPELFETVVDSAGNNGVVLQIQFAEAVEAEASKPFASPLGKKRGGGIKLSKSPTPPRGRTRQRSVSPLSPNVTPTRRTPTRSTSRPRQNPNKKAKSNAGVPSATNTQIHKKKTH